MKASDFEKSLENTYNKQVKPTPTTQDETRVSSGWIDESAQEGVSEVAEKLAMQIVHSEEGFYQPVYERTLATLEALLLRQRTEIEESVRGVLPRIEMAKWGSENQDVYVAFQHGEEHYRDATLSALDKLFAKPTK